jgi:DNA (cytosine-5)-methyltransferase 1
MIFIFIFKINMKQLTFIEVCSGAGGLSSGFIKSGFKPIFLNEINPVFCETLKKNHPETRILCGSMKNIPTLNYREKVDVLMGGIPCQSFSQSGKRLGLEDERGGLILYFIKLINKLKPKVFLIENVVGLKTHNNGKTLSFILDELKKTGYSVKYQVLNANDYGVAQNRKRLFIIGFMNKEMEKKFEFPKPELYKPVLKDVLKNVPESDGYTYSEEKREVLELVPPGGCWVDLPEDIQRSYMKNSFFSEGGKRGIARRLSMDEPSLTLTTSPCQKQTERCHPLETRPLTIREYARIQSFPDDFVFCGSKSQIYTQIGNAVPVKLAQAVSSSISKILV